MSPERAMLAREGYDVSKFYINKRDSEIYYLRVITRPDDTGVERPVYCLKNVVHYWEGTEEQFKAAFET
jgi:hypothetical protein